jgi:hypothetical protein
MCYHDAMALGVWFRFCVTAASVTWSGCSSSEEDCPGHCEPQPWPTGPSIYVASGVQTIASIETLGGCSVVWFGLVNPGSPEQVCPPEPIDASWPVDGCAQRYRCEPSLAQFDGGSACTSAIINMAAEHCLVTVASTAGERQSFEVTRIQPTSYSRCHTADGTCHGYGWPSVWPGMIPVHFASSGTDAAPIDAAPFD